MSLLYPNNKERYERIKFLQSDVDAIEEKLVKQESIHEEKEPIYKSVVNKLAQHFNYPSSKEMANEARRYLELTNAEEWEKYENAYEATDKAMITLDALGFVIEMVGMTGSRKVRKLGGGKYPWSSWDYETAFTNKAWNNIKYNATRRLKASYSRGEISKDVLTQKIRKLDSFKDVVFANPNLTGSADEIAKATKFIKLIRYASVALEITGAVLAIVGLITELVAGAILKDRMKETIRDIMVPHRFLLWKYKMHLDVWDRYQTDIISAINAWVGLQPEPGSDGNDTKSNLDAQDKLRNVLDTLFDACMLGFQEITNEKVRDDLAEHDSLNRQYVDDDPHYEFILASIKKLEDEADAEDPDPEPVPLPIDDRPYGVPAIPAEEINGHTICYVELKDNKGCFWKLRGPFWTWQEGPNADGSMQKRHRLIEVRRTAQAVYLQKQENPKYKIDEDGNATLQPYEGPPEPIWQLNTDNNQLWWREDGNWETASVPYDGYDFDATTFSNLVDINGWTTFGAPTPEGASATRLYEYNSIRGWEVHFTSPPIGAPSIFPGFQEKSRDKTKIQIEHYWAGITADFDLSTSKYMVVRPNGTVEAEETFDPEDVYVRLVLT